MRLSLRNKKRSYSVIAIVQTFVVDPTSGKLIEVDLHEITIAMVSDILLTKQSP